MEPSPASGSPAGSPLSEQQFAAVFEFASVGMAWLDTRSRALRVNRAMCRMLGRTQAQLAGALPEDVGHPDDVKRDLELRALMLAGTFPSYQFEKRYRHADGHTVWAHQTCTLVRDGQGRPAHFIVQAQDLSEHKAAEAALRETKERFRATFEQAALGIAHIGLDGRMLRANRRLCEMHGYSRDELVGRPARDLMADQGASADPDIGKLMDGVAASYTAERRFLRRNGEVYPVRVSVTLVRSEEAQPYFISFIEDLSQHQADQRRIREQAEMLDQANDAIVVHETDRTVRYWNKGAERLFGWGADEAIGRTFAELLGPDAGLDEAQLRELLRRGHWVGLVRCHAADGRLLDVERRFTVIHDDEGRPAAVLSVNTDATERLRAQRGLEDLNSLLEQRIRERTAQLEESNDELRIFAYSLAHDLRAPLAAIDGFSSELERRLGEGLDASGRHYLGRVRAGVRQMADLTEAMLSLTHLSQAPLLRQAVDLSATAQAWLHRMQEQHPQRVVEVRIAATPKVEGDVRLLADLMENLLGNAWKFTSQREGAVIEFGSERGEDGSPVYFVRDNGAGFDAAYADKLFGPFQRLHTAAEFPGTGIGLAIVRKIVTRHGGRVWAESRVSQGATFFFTLAQSKS
jgi:PAS domain S-box-containing protein